MLELAIIGIRFTLGLVAIYVVIWSIGKIIDEYTNNKED